MQIDTMKKLQAFIERNGKNPEPPKPTKEGLRRATIQDRMEILVAALRRQS